MEDVARIPFDDLEIDLNKMPNPREGVDDEYISTLHARIKRTRQVVPLAVWYDAETGKYLVADGLSRYFALEELKKQDPDLFEVIFGDGAPCQLLHGAARDAVITGIVYNIDRKNYGQIEMINSCKILEDGGLDREAIAACLQVSKKSVRRWLAFDRNAAAATKKAVAAGEVTLHAATPVANLPKEEQPAQLARVREETDKNEKRGSNKDMAALARDMRNLSNSGNKPNKKSPRPSMKMVRAQLKSAVDEQEERMLHAKGKPVDITDIGRDGSNAAMVVTYQQDIARLQGRIDALEWVVGERQDLE